MKIRLKLVLVIASIVLTSCGGDNDKKEKKQLKIGDNSTQKATPYASTKEASKDLAIDMSNKGIGPIKKLELKEPIDATIVKLGEDLFKSKCMACHKPHKKFIGPAPVGILERRSPEWIMNMILNPEEMTQKDPIARQMLIDHNGSPMANQSLTESEARSILEYFRTLKTE